MNKTRFKWPAWLPYPSSWLRVLSIVPFFPIGAYSSLLLSVAFFFIVTSPPSESEARGFSLLVILFVTAVLLVCAFIYALFHHKLSRRAKGWIPTLLSDWKGLYAMVVVNIATAPLWPLSFLFAKRTHYYSYGEIIKRIEIPESVEQIMLISFFLVGAAMFQIEFIIYQRWEIKRQKRLEKKRKQQ